MKTRSFRCLIALLLTVCLFTMVSCGGGGDGDSSGGGSGMYRMADVESALNSTLGADRGLDAVIYAMNGGYSAAQIATAIMENRLNASGVIVNSGGGVEAPAYAPSDILLARTLMDQSDRDRAAEVKGSIEAIAQSAKNHGKNWGQAAILMILVLASEGYSPEQITNFLFNGSITRTPESLKDQFKGVAVIIDGNDQIMLPNRERTDLFIDAKNMTLVSCPNGTFSCGDSSVVCSSKVCDLKNDCANGSDEADSRCGVGYRCCVSTHGCPQETGSSCAENCCCCGVGEACDQSNWQNGCVANSQRRFLDLENMVLRKY